MTDTFKLQHVDTVKFHNYLFTGCSLFKGDGRSKEEIAAFSEYGHCLENMNDNIGGIKENGKFCCLLQPKTPDRHKP